MRFEVSWDRIRAIQVEFLSLWTLVRGAWTSSPAVASYADGRALSLDRLLLYVPRDQGLAYVERLLDL